MKTGTIITLSVIGLLATIAIANYISYANFGNRSERGLEGTATNNQNILAQYGQKVMEVASVSEIYRDDVQNTTTAAIQGRYGENGSKAIFQMLREQNPTLDSKIYTQIQQVMESGRNEFQQAQSKLIDQRRVYQTALGNVWAGFWLNMAGYPKVDLATTYIPITTDRAAAVFKAGKESGPIKLR